MKTFTRMLILGLVALLACAVAISFVSAVPTPTPAPVGSIYTTDSAGNYMYQFSPGETIVLHYFTSVTGDNTNIQVLNSANVVIKQYTSQPQMGTETLVINTPGTYKIDVNGKAINLAVATIFVLPESVIGALAALCAGLVAFGVYQIKLKKK